MKITGKYTDCDIFAKTLEDDIYSSHAPTNEPEFLQRYFDTTSNTWKTWNGTSWV